MVLFFTHIPFVVNHTINATPPERLQQLQCHEFVLLPCYRLAAYFEYCRIEYFLMSVMELQFLSKYFEAVNTAVELLCSIW